MSYAKTTNFKLLFKMRQSMRKVNRIQTFQKHSTRYYRDLKVQNIIVNK